MAVLAIIVLWYALGVIGSAMVLTNGGDEIKRRGLENTLKFVDLKKLCMTCGFAGPIMLLGGISFMVTNYLNNKRETKEIEENIDRWNEMMKTCKWNKETQTWKKIN